MANALIANWVHETTTSTGTGSLTLTAVRRRFSTVFGTGGTTDVFIYAISNRDVPTEYEVGTGHMSATSTFVRDTVIESSNSNSLVSFSAGTKDVTNGLIASTTLRLGDALTTFWTGTAATDGTKSSGTYKPTTTGSNLKYITNGGAFTLAAPDASGDYTIILQITNNGSAGAISNSGFNKVSGDAFTTTNGDDFFVFITKINGFTSAVVQALQ